MRLIRRKFQRRSRARAEVGAAAEVAREILVRLEAAPFVATLDTAMGRTSDQPMI